MRVQRVLPIVACGLLAATAAIAGAQSAAVSPGDASKLVLIGDTCPTFSWDAVEGAVAHELVVYQIDDAAQAAEPILKQAIPGSASSWTPSLESCLERGGQYAWSVRAVGKNGASEWSALSLFEVAGGPSEAAFEAALEIVQQYIAGVGVGVSPNNRGFASGEAQAPSSGLLGPQPGDTPAPLASVSGGDSALQVNGSAVVTVATLAGALCSMTEVRFLDQGDGTVLDCNTGKMWLKDASCLGLGPWDDPPYTSVFALVADLNDLGVGSDFGCEDYTEGTYTDWEVPAMEDLCGLWIVGSCAGTNCCTASAGLVDTAFSAPTVGNAAGDGQWAADDAFVAVQSNIYWSATEQDATHAYRVDLFNGSVSYGLTDYPRFVWPVRGGQ